MKMTFRRVLQTLLGSVVAAGAVLTSVPAGAVTFYYVAKSGADTPCTLARENAVASPFLTIQAAANCVKTNRPNLTGLGPFAVQVQDSQTYAESVLIPVITTTATDTLSIRSAPGLVPLPEITGAGTTGYGIDDEGVPNVIIDGFSFTSSVTGVSYVNGVSINNAANNVEVRNCRFHDMGDFGVVIGYSIAAGATLAAAGGANVHHNVFSNIKITGNDGANSGDCVHIMNGSTGWILRNNTFYNCTAAAVFTMGDAPAESGGTFTNNVIYAPATCSGKAGTPPRLPPCAQIDIGDAATGGQTGLTTDYNTIFLPAGSTMSTGIWGTTVQATLANWQTASAQDAHSLNTDPLFVAAATSDFHEMSSGGRVTNAAPTTFTSDAGTTCSPAIDAGNPATGWPLETAASGSRVNQGAYGNTAQASRSCACLEPNNSAADGNNTRTDTRVCALERTVSRSGVELLPAGDATDFFYFNNATPGSWKFDYSNTTTSAFNLYLYDQAGTLIASSLTTNPTPIGTAICVPAVAIGADARSFTPPALVRALYYVEVREVCGGSGYTLVALPVAPLSELVSGFEALGHDHAVRVSWDAQGDPSVIGFRVRRTDSTGATVIIGPDPLTVDSYAPQSFAQEDDGVTCGSNYQYSLDALKADGTTETFGPVNVTACASSGRGDGGGCGALLSVGGSGRGRPARDWVPMAGLAFAAAAALRAVRASKNRPA